MIISSKSADGRAELLVNDKAVATWTGDDLRDGGEAAACATLLPAIRAGQGELIIRGEISEQLASGLETLQDIFCRWLPEASRVKIRAESRSSKPGVETGLFFSGGVDSFHAALKHRTEVDRLIYVEGFDVPASKPVLRDRVRHRLHEAAALLDKPLTVLETDIRAWSDARVEWPMYHGAALATAAHLLGGILGRVIVPSTYAYEELFPWGSHPLSDPLWSGNVEILHSGSEVSRVEKIRAIANDPASRKTLRVCWQNPDEEYNCGRCEKCLRTMTTLAAFDVLGSFPTFPNTLTAQNVAAVDLRSASSMKFAKSNIALLDEHELRGDLRDAWRTALHGGTYRQRLRRQAGRLLRRVDYRARRVRGN